ncbi:hypothetical protein HYY75_04410 [bacterium]|nr:hypothetical protein [bacterium]
MLKKVKTTVVVLLLFVFLVLPKVFSQVSNLKQSPLTPKILDGREIGRNLNASSESKVSSSVEKTASECGIVAISSQTQIENLGLIASSYNEAIGTISNSSGTHGINNSTDSKNLPSVKETTENNSGETGSASTVVASETSGEISSEGEPSTQDEDTSQSQTIGKGTSDGEGTPPGGDRGDTVPKSARRSFDAALESFIYKELKDTLSILNSGRMDDIAKTFSLNNQGVLRDQVQKMIVDGNIKQFDQKYSVGFVDQIVNGKVIVRFLNNPKTGLVFELDRRGKWKISEIYDVNEGPSILKDKKNKK